MRERSQQCSLTLSQTSDFGNELKKTAFLCSLFLFLLTECKINDKIKSQIYFKEDIFMLLKNSKWICYPAPWGEGECPVFRKAFNTKGELKRATLKISSLGCYYAELGGKRIGDFILAPGWTFYKRAQVQCYDVTDLIDKDNELRVTVGGGWFKGRINERNRRELPDKRPALICELELAYKNGDKEYIYSDESWQGALGKLTFSDIYDGEHFDANLEEQFGGVQVQDCSFVTLVPQQGEKSWSRRQFAPTEFLKPLRAKP